MFLARLFFPFLITLLACFRLSASEPAKVGLLIVATGKYISFVDPLIASAKKHFCRNQQVTYFVFTDQDYQPSENTVCIYQPRLGWPYDTMMRYHVYFDHQDLFAEQDYLFACDADMLFVGDVGDEILGERVATLHPGLINKPGTYERNPRSRAFVRRKEARHYFAGGFYGGKRESFLHILKTNIDRINDDLKQNIIAVWHDESHWNRYCIDFPPTVILSPSYCYPESWDLPYPKKLLALDKNHEALRK